MALSSKQNMYHYCNLHFFVGLLWQAIQVYRLAMFICVSCALSRHFHLSFWFEQKLSNEKGYKLETRPEGYQWQVLMVYVVILTLTLVLSIFKVKLWQSDHTVVSGLMWFHYLIIQKNIVKLICSEDWFHLS